MASGAALAVEIPSAPRRLLHVGCGRRALPEELSDCDETRVDLDPSCNPDFIASMTDLRAVGEGYSAVYSSHALEHVDIRDALQALREFRRVLAPGGAAIVLVPDLEGVLPTLDVVYECEAGPITGMDMFYGHLASLRDSPYMAHRCGFIAQTLEAAMQAAGFERIKVTRTIGRSLIAVGFA